MTAEASQAAHKTAVEIPGLPAFLDAPYSQMVRCGEWLFGSGQVAIDPNSGRLCPPEIAEQTHQVMRNTQALLEAAGSSLDNVVSTRIYLADLGDWEAMNTAYAAHVGDVPPARAAIQVGLPEGVLVEIAVIAHA